MQSWGPSVAFNAFDQEGRLVGYREVERMCGLRGVCLRGGSFCNPGAAARAFGLTAAMVKEAHKARCKPTRPVTAAAPLHMHFTSIEWAVCSDEHCRRRLGASAATAARTRTGGRSELSARRSGCRLLSR